MTAGGVTVPVNFHVGGNWAAQLKAIGEQSKAVGKSITGIGNTSALGKLGDKLQATTEGLHKFRLGVEETVEQLFIFGAQGSSLVNEIENIRDPLKRLELAQLALSGQTSTLGTALTGVTQRFAEMKARAAIAVGGVENLTLILGAATVAGGALAGVIGTTLKAAYDRAANGLDLYIEKNKEAQALQQFTAQAADANAQKLGESLYSVTSDFKLAEAASTSFADKYLANAAKILQGTTTYSKAIQDVWGVQLPSLLTPVVDVIGKVGAGFGNAALHLDKFAAIANKLATPLRNTHTATQILTKTFDGQRVAVEQLKLALSTYGAQLDDVANKARKATPFLDALTGGQGTRQSEELGAPHFEAKRAGGGAGGGGRRDAARRAFGAALAGQVGGFGERGGEGAGAAAGLGGIASEAAGRRAGAGVLGGAGTATGGAVSDKDAANLAKGAASGKLLTGILNDGKAAAQGLAGSLADVAAGLASGSLKAGDFGAAIKGAFGGIFKDLGRGFVLQGTALLFTPGGQAAGAGMIGAGLALSVLGGAMSRGGGGSAPGGGGGAGAAASGAVSAAARQAATGTGGRDSGPRTVILQVGQRELQGTLVDLTQDGQARNMGRRPRR